MRVWVRVGDAARFCVAQHDDGIVVYTVERGIINTQSGVGVFFPSKFGKTIMWTLKGHKSPRTPS